ncbi:MAG: CopY family transcriptional repressor [Bacteroidetes bacterium RBG_19FT_COMBO_42_7]|nr:MAG: CopY family transcriptional repressor [Bacteroidetes bacterium RBG_13_42_15]OFY74298.1 MAG: CopY family transcriptional repressor [Bacteroidetes bacterium RBG_19FT_COMBO_42_7]
MKEKREMYLTRAEEQIMQILWDLGEGLVREVRERFPDPKPVRNTVSTVIRILERKGFVGHKTYGNVHVYYPLVSRESYSKSQLLGLMENYFDNSFPAMVSFFAKETDLTIGELDKVLKELRNELKGGTKNE